MFFMSVGLPLEPAFNAIELQNRGRFTRGDCLGLSAFGAGFIAGSVYLRWAIAYSPIAVQRSNPRDAGTLRRFLRLARRNVKRTAVPLPSSLSALIWPPWTAPSRFAIASPGR